MLLETVKNQIIHTNDKEAQYRLAHFLGGRINWKKNDVKFTVPRETHTVDKNLLVKIP